MVSGRITSTGALSLTTRGTSGSASFSGSITRAGTVAGTWTYLTGTLDGGGTFTGERR